MSKKRNALEQALDKVVAREQEEKKSKKANEQNKKTLDNFFSKL